MPCLSRLNGIYEQYNVQYINRRYRMHGLIYQLCVCILFICHDFSSSMHLCFSRNFLKKCYLKTSIGKCHECLEINFVRFFLAQFHPMKVLSQLLYYNISYSRSYRPILSRKLQWKKIKNMSITCKSYYCKFFDFQ